MWELDYKESWAPKNWFFWTVVLEKTIESHLDCKEIQPVHSEGDQPWDFFGRNDAKAETSVLWPPHTKSWLIGKDLDDGRDWEQEEKETTEDEMAGWHHRLHGRDFEWTLGVGGGQGGLACCNSCGHKESDTTERLNWTETKIKVLERPYSFLEILGGNPSFLFYVFSRRSMHSLVYGPFPYSVTDSYLFLSSRHSGALLLLPSSILWTLMIILGSLS